MIFPFFTIMTMLVILWVASIFFLPDILKKRENEDLLVSLNMDQVRYHANHAEAFAFAMVDFYKSLPHAFDLDLNDEDQRETFFDLFLEFLDRRVPQ